MKIFTAQEVRSIDDYTIRKEPIASIDLMERAASRLSAWYVKKFKSNRELVIFAGPGNNGGDALAMARQLHERQYRVSCYLLSKDMKLSPDCQVNLDRLGEVDGLDVHVISKVDHIPSVEDNKVIIDGIFGSGLSRPAEGLFGELIKMINQSDAATVSIDIPSGLFGEDNSGNNLETIINADHTLTFQFPFLSFFFVENNRFTGEWHILDISLHPQKIAETRSNYSLSCRTRVSELIRERAKFSHKGSYGHALLIAGSYGMMGAAILSGRAALRGGAGLVTIHIPKVGYEIIQTAIPEAIVSIDQSEILFSDAPDLAPFSAVAAGPGLGSKPNTARGISALLRKCTVPMVLDADALNILAQDQNLLELLPENTLLTPHPAEFDRIAGVSDNGFDRHTRQIEFSKKYRVIVVLKGAHTGISFPDGTYVFNMTGNPGMATGGSGDVLTGIIVSLLAKGLKPDDAASAGVFLHGLAGDIAAEEKSQEAMIAGDIIDSLGEAFKKLKAKPLMHGRRGGIYQ